VDQSDLYSTSYSRHPSRTIAGVYAGYRTVRHLYRNRYNYLGAAALAYNMAPIPHRIRQRLREFAARRRRGQPVVNNRAVPMQIDAPRRRRAVITSYVPSSKKKGSKRSISNRSMKRSKKTKGTKKVSNSMAIRKGSIHNDQISGVITDANCVYLSVLSYDPTSIVKYMLEAIFRHLFKVTLNFDADSLDQLICLPGSVPTDDWKITLVKRVITTNVLDVGETYTASSTSTIRIVAAAFLDQFLVYSSGEVSTGASGGARNTTELVKFVLEKKDAFSTADDPALFKYRFAGDIDFRELKFHVKTNTKIKMQNRTTVTRAFVVDGDEHDVANNPIEGYCYKFNNVPKTANVAIQGLTKFALPAVRVGVQVNTATALAAETGIIGGATYQVPPPPKAFYNIKGSARMRLDPGVIKTSSLKYEKTQSLLLFLKTLKYSSGASTDFSNAHVVGPCKMFAFEDVIFIGSSAINLAYEVERTSFVYVTVKKSTHPIQNSVYSVEYNS